MQDISTILAGQKIISYRALRTEVPLSQYLPLTSVAYEILPRPTLSPSKEALATMQAIGSAPACILIPGRRFDALGTRHGQGGGWYDRFLARVPSEWIRIGFCFHDQFSHELLKRESWDQPMDYVYVVDRATGAASLHTCPNRL